jgi:hypothetical protein
MYVSYSGFKLFSSCAYAYWHQYVNKTELDEPDDRSGSLYGSIIGIIFEDFYNEEMWRDPSTVRENLSQKVRHTTDKVIRQETSPSWRGAGGVIRWRGEGKDHNPKGMYSNKEELIEDIRKSIPQGLKTIKFGRFLGPYARAEVRLDQIVQGHKIGGRADFIIHRIKPHNDIVIIDGKGSKWGGKYVDPRQLYWYGMLYQLQHGRLPDKLGFLYWRFPPPRSIDWVEFSEADTESLLEEVLSAIDKIEEFSSNIPAGLDFVDRMDCAKRLFKPKANENNCRFCPYATPSLCTWGASVARKIKSKKP